MLLKHLKTLKTLEDQKYLGTKLDTYFNEQRAKR